MGGKGKRAQRVGKTRRSTPPTQTNTFEDGEKPPLIDVIGSATATTTSPNTQRQPLPLQPDSVHTHSLASRHLLHPQCPQERPPERPLPSPPLAFLAHESYHSKSTTSLITRRSPRSSPLSINANLRARLGTFCLGCACRCVLITIPLLH